MITKIGDVEFASQEEVFEFLGRKTKEISDNLPKVKKETKVNQINNLRSAYLDQELVFVVGAGASVDFGTPNWNSLLQKLLMLTIEKQPDIAIVLAKLFTSIFNLNSVIAGRYLQNYFLNKKDDLAFEKEVRRILYESSDKKRESKLMQEIAKFCIAAGKSPNLDSIITYNYDDILETYLDDLNLDIPYKSIYGNGMTPKNGELPIYHVHGYLPERGKLTKNNEITLGEGIYHQQYTDIYSWNNITQINKFRDKTCLFIGTSLNDPNTRRLLDIARIQKGDQDHYHFIVKKEYDLNEIKNDLKDILSRNKVLLDEKSSANLKIDETSLLLKEIIERFEENDSMSFGVKTIWVKEYSDYPKILADIKKAHNK